MAQHRANIGQPRPNIGSTWAQDVPNIDHMGATWPNLGPRCAPDSLTLLNIGPTKSQRERERETERERERERHRERERERQRETERETERERERQRERERDRERERERERHRERERGRETDRETERESGEPALHIPKPKLSGVSLINPGAGQDARGMPGGPSVVIDAGPGCRRPSVPKRGDPVVTTGSLKPL